MVSPLSSCRPTHKARKWLDTPLQVGPKLYPSVPPYCVWTGSYVLHPLAPASILSSEVPALQKNEDTRPPDTGPYLET